MIAQHDNNVLSSMILWANYTLFKKGQAYTNHGSLFYRSTGTISPYYVYSAPFKPFVADFAVSGPNVMTGIYLNGSLLNSGQSGFVGIDYQRGSVYFSNPVTGTLSGNYSVCDFTVKATNSPDEKLILETKHLLRPKVSSQTTGLSWDSTTYPVVYFKIAGGQNNEFAFGGMDESVTRIRAIVLADSLFSRDGVCSIFKDKVRSHVALFSGVDMPYDSLGRIRGGSYNYCQVASGKDNSQTVYLKKVSVSSFNQESFQSLTAMNTDVFVALVDFDVCAYRYPRL
jgi:hypothetical protein